MVKKRKESGLTVSEWCKQNGINIKAYYYRPKRIRQAVCNKLEKHDIVPVEPFKDTHHESEKSICPITHHTLAKINPRVETRGF